MKVQRHDKKPTVITQKMHARCKLVKGNWRFIYFCCTVAHIKRDIDEKLFSIIKRTAAVYV